MTRPIADQSASTRYRQTQDLAQDTEVKPPEIRQDAEDSRKDGMGIKRARSPQGSPYEAAPDSFSEPSYKKRRTEDDSADTEALPLTIHSALLRRHPQQALSLLAAPDVDFAARNRDALTPLMCAVRSGSLSLVRQVWQAMPDTQPMRPLREEAFLQAVKSARTEIVRDLLQRQPDLAKVRYHDQRTALHWAAVGGNAAEAKLLLAAQAEVSPVDAQGNTPFLLMARHDEVAVYAPLREHGAELGATNAARRNAVVEAALSGSYGVLDCLLAECREAKGTKQDFQRMKEDPLADVLIITSILRSKLSAQDLEAGASIPCLGAAELDQVVVVLSSGAPATADLAFFVSLCVAVSGQTLPSSNSGKQTPPSLPPAVTVGEKMQRRAVLAELLAAASSVLLEGEKLEKSSLSDPTKAWLRKISSVRSDALKKISMECFSELAAGMNQQLTALVLERCVNVDGELLETQLRNTLTNEYRLSVPVAGLLAGAIALVLTETLPDTQNAQPLTWGERMAVNSAHRRRRMQALPDLLKTWDEEILRQKKSDLSVTQENAHPSHDSDDAPEDKASERDRLPPLFYESLGDGLRRLAGAPGQVSDAYVALIFGQWDAVLSVLTGSAPGKPGQHAPAVSIPTVQAGDGLELDL